MANDLPAAEPLHAPPEPTTNRCRWMLAAALLVHLGLATYYAFLLPLWGAVPDEPIHYSHVKYVAENWRLPVIADPFRDLKEYYFVADPAGAAQHGPAFYWPAAVLYKLTEGLTLCDQQYALRLYSVLLGLVMVYLAWIGFALLFPDEPWVVFGATLLLTLMPHRLLISAVIYADIMAAATAALAVWALIRATVRDETTRGWLWAGLALGVAMVAKTSALLILPLAAAALFLRWRQQEAALPALAARFGVYLLGMLALSGCLLVRSVYL